MENNTVNNHKYRFIEGFRSAETTDQQKERTSEKIIEKYQKLMKSKETFPYKFPMCTKQGVLCAWEEDVSIRLDNDTAQGKYSLPDSYNRIPGDTLMVSVKEVRPDSKKIFLSNQKDFSERENIIGQLEDGIRNEDYIRVPAKVVGFSGIDYITKAPNNSIVLLDIAGMGILGVIRSIQWSTTKTKCPKYFVSIGDDVEVVVTKCSKWNYHNVFDCSRRLVLEADGIDPWDDIEKKISTGLRVEVTCTELKKDHFFGVINGINDIEVLCEYPVKDSQIMIIPGQKYFADVTKVNVEKKKLTVKIKGWRNNERCIENAGR